MLFDPIALAAVVESLRADQARLREQAAAGVDATARALEALGLPVERHRAGDQSPPVLIARRRYKAGPVLALHADAGSPPAIAVIVTARLAIEKARLRPAGTIELHVATTEGLAWLLAAGRSRPGRAIRADASGTIAGDGGLAACLAAAASAEFGREVRPGEAGPDPYRDAGVDCATFGLASADPGPATRTLARALAGLTEATVQL